MDSSQQKQNTEIIAQEICKKVGSNLTEIRAKKNNTRIITARNFTYYILHTRFGVSINNICDLIGRTNREVCYRLAVVRDKEAASVALKKRFDRIAQQVKETLNL